MAKRRLTIAELAAPGALSPTLPGGAGGISVPRPQAPNLPDPSLSGFGQLADGLQSVALQVSRVAGRLGAQQRERRERDELARAGVVAERVPDEVFDRIREDRERFLRRARSGGGPDAERRALSLAMAAAVDRGDIPQFVSPRAQAAFLEGVGRRRAREFAATLGESFRALVADQSAGPDLDFPDAGEDLIADGIRGALESFAGDETAAAAFLAEANPTAAQFRTQVIQARQARGEEDLRAGEAEDLLAGRTDGGVVTFPGLVGMAQDADLAAEDARAQLEVYAEYLRVDKNLRDIRGLVGGAMSAQLRRLSAAAEDLDDLPEMAKIVEIVAAAEINGVVMELDTATRPGSTPGAQYIAAARELIEETEQRLIARELTLGGRRQQEVLNRASGLLHLAVEDARRTQGDIREAVDGFLAVATDHPALKEANGGRDLPPYLVGHIQAEARRVLGTEVERQTPVPADVRDRLAEMESSRVPFEERMDFLRALEEDGRVPWTFLRSYELEQGDARPYEEWRGDSPEYRRRVLTRVDRSRVPEFLASGQQARFQALAADAGTEIDRLLREAAGGEQDPAELRRRLDAAVRGPEVGAVLRGFEESLQGAETAAFEAIRGIEQRITQREYTEAQALLDSSGDLLSSGVRQTLQGELSRERRNQAAAFEAAPFQRARASLRNGLLSALAESDLTEQQVGAAVLAAEAQLSSQFPAILEGVSGLPEEARPAATEAALRSAVQGLLEPQLGERAGEILGGAPLQDVLSRGRLQSTADYLAVARGELRLADTEPFFTVLGELPPAPLDAVDEFLREGSGWFESGAEAEERVRNGALQATLLAPAEGADSAYLAYAGATGIPVESVLAGTWEAAGLVRPGGAGFIDPNLPEPPGGSGIYGRRTPAEEAAAAQELAVALRGLGYETEVVTPGEGETPTVLTSRGPQTAPPQTGGAPLVRIVRTGTLDPRRIHPRLTRIEGLTPDNAQEVLRAMGVLDTVENAKTLLSAQQRLQALWLNARSR